MPQVSFIIPVYNTEAYLEECLQSVQNQTFTDFEAIIINDGSTDNSEAIIQKFVNSDKRFKTIYQDNQGPSAARNKGLQRVDSPWISFVDSDDMIAPDFLKTLLALTNVATSTKEESVDVVCCGTKKISGRITLSATSPKGKIKCWNSEGALTQALYQDRVPDHSAWNKLYAKDLWKETQFPSGKIFEDLATIPSILLKARKVVSTDAPLYLYRIRDNSILRSNYTIHEAELLQIAEDNFLFLKNGSTSSNKKLIKAAQNTVISASFSILKRTPNTEEFYKVRQQAWQHIRDLRISNLLNSNTRLRNKIADVLSFLPQNLFLKFLRRG